MASFAMFACIVVARPLLDLIGFDPKLAEATTNCTHILAYGAIAHMGGLACQFYLEALRQPNIATAINMVAVAFNLVFGLMPRARARRYWRGVGDDGLALVHACVLRHRGGVR